MTKVRRTAEYEVTVTYVIKTHASSQDDAIGRVIDVIRTEDPEVKISVWKKVK